MLKTSLARLHRLSRSGLAAAAGIAIGLAAGSATPAWADVDSIRLDYAYYSPVSLVLKEQGWLEEEFAADGIEINWVLSLGSNKALEFLNSGSVDFSSSAGAAALLAKVNGNPLKSIYIYSKPEWTALVTRPDTGITKIEDLKGKTVAVTRGTDPYIFLLRALDSVGLTEKDIQPVLIQHPDGKNALVNGDVDAWAGLDPHMAQAELDNDAVLFYRNADANTYGVLNVREEFANENPELVERVLAVYEKARKWSIEHPDEVRAALVRATKISDEVAAIQLDQRTDLTDPVIGEKQRESILAAGIVLQKAGIIPAEVDVAATVDAQIDDQYIRRVTEKLAAGQ
jgi:sulfonate transport system substrate-binding protein